MARNFCIFTTLLLSLVAGSALAQSNSPSLGDVARQKSSVKAKHVVTNDEIPPSPDADKPVASPAGGTKADVPATGTDAAAKPQSAPDPKARIAQLTKDNEETRRVIATLEAKIEASDDKKLIPALVEIVETRKRVMAQNEAEIEKLKAGGVPAAANAGNSPTPTPAVSSPQTSSK
ncbi:MAG: hypothetical protein ACXVZT_01150 [Terriglobales bacterium]